MSFLQNQLRAVPEIVGLAKQAFYHFQNENDAAGRNILVQVYNSIKTNPNQIKDVADYYVLSVSFFMMLDQGLTDDFDTQQTIASLGYLFISKAIENDNNNLNLIKDRLLLLKIGHEPLKYTVMSIINRGVSPLTSSFAMSSISARDEIYKMEIADLELHPQLYRQVPFFKERKDYFDQKVNTGFFKPDNTYAEIIKSGIEFHGKLLSYIENKVIKQGDIDF